MAVPLSARPAIRAKVELRIPVRQSRRWYTKVKAVATSPMLKELSPHIEEYRDERWWRDATRSISTVLDAERFVDHVGFAAALTDSRRPGPSLYVAVCGRRDAVLPRNVQTDPEVSLAWNLKDQLVRRGKVYYAKLARGRTMFVSLRMIPHFHA